MSQEFEKVSFGGNIRGNKSFQEGVELFRNTHNFPPLFAETREKIGNEKLEGDPVAYFKWYKKLVGKEQVGNLHVLSMEGIGKNKRYLVAFRSVKPQDDCLEMTAVEIRNILEK